MKVILELVGQYSNIRCVTVRHDIVIGRGSECNLRVSAPQVSRRHCFLRISEGQVSVTDLESSNGTWLDGQRVVPGKRYFIEDGMMVAVGPVKFTATLAEDDEVSAEDVTPVRPAHNPALAPDPLAPESMDFALEHAGDSAPEDEPTRDYSAAAAEISAGKQVRIVPGDLDEDTAHPDDESIRMNSGNSRAVAAQLVDILTADDFNSNDDIEEIIVLDNE